MYYIPGNKWVINKVLFVENQLLTFEGENGEVGSVEEHGSTPSLWVHSHNWNTRIVQQTSL